MIRSAALPVAEAAALTNRKKYRAVEVLQASNATIFLTGQPNVQTLNIMI